MLEDMVDSVNDENGVGLDVVQKFAYESSFRQFQENIFKSARLHLDFWTLLKDDKPDMSKLNDVGSKINKSIVMIENFWN